MSTSMPSPDDALRGGQKPDRDVADVLRPSHDHVPYPLHFPSSGDAAAEMLALHRALDEGVKATVGTDDGVTISPQPDGSIANCRE
eukprot:CAMPEP_0170635626 /NCGR_PEP_ID=MMETSP0224-20130122/37324_1 /TAXON_ID=285029 /ORGANISM="Togula jolla, Strain CCCM 725" /LENGTH=85 /DNA_ID=CAMNT_0010965143 /DNA_START=8 /DNA_END=267 /DNA_ORIENTATION=+